LLLVGFAKANEIKIREGFKSRSERKIPLNRHDMTASKKEKTKKKRNS
jgi:hypothetical protein